MLASSKWVGTFAPVRMFFCLFFMYSVYFVHLLYLVYIYNYTWTINQKFIFQMVEWRANFEAFLNTFINTHLLAPSPGLHYSQSIYLRLWTLAKFFHICKIVNIYDWYEVLMEFLKTNLFLFGPIYIFNEQLKSSLQFCFVISFIILPVFHFLYTCLTLPCYCLTNLQCKVFLL